MLTLPLLISALLPSAAHAADDDAIAPPLPSTTLSVDVRQLIGPTLELTAERRLGERASVALTAGGGRLRVVEPQSDQDSEEAAPVRHLNGFGGGAEFRWYGMGDFANALYVGVGTSYARSWGTLDDNDIDGVYVTVTPILGIKISSEIGLCLDVHMGGGPQFESRDVTDSPHDLTLSKYPALVLNPNIGWNF